VTQKVRDENCEGVDLKDYAHLQTKNEKDISGTIVVNDAVE